MRLGTKLLLGFAVIILIAVLQSVFILYAVNKAESNIVVLADEYTPAVATLNQLEQAITMAGYYYRAYFYVRDEALYKQGYDQYQLFSKLAADLLAHAQKYPSLAALAADTQAMIKDGAAYQVVSQDINTGILGMKTSMETLGANEEVFENSLDAFFKRMDTRWNEVYAAAGQNPSSQLVEQLNDTRTSHFTGTALMENFDMGIGDFWQGLARFNVAEMTEATECFGDLASLAKQAIDHARDPQDKELLVAAGKAADNVGGIFRTIEGIWSQMLVKASERVKYFNNLLATTGRLTGDYSKIMQNLGDNNRVELGRVNILQMAGLAATVVLGVIISYFLTRSITRPLDRMINALSAGSGELARSAGAITGSSKDLSDGATAQAASLEETSAALEEMTSMTRRNADNARETDEITRATAGMVDRGAESVRNMTKAMDEINDSSEKIGNIIKTIEGIAFQTNLLALNAAVEAARAGEAGKGFAVVADEVRNLAQRSAQAARDTNELIAGTVERVRNGAQISSGMEENFRGIEEGVQKTGKLVSEISAATNEQAQGADQINQSVAQMDRVTQATAQESQRSLEEAQILNRQADSMSDMVAQLIRLVHGHAAVSRIPAAPPPARPKVMKALPLPE